MSVRGSAVHTNHKPVYYWVISH